MYDKLRPELHQSELLRLHSDGVSIVDAWIDFDPEGEPDDLELRRSSQNPIILDRIEKARQALLILLRNRTMLAVGRSPIRFMGGDSYSLIPPMICRMNYVDWSTGSIKDKERSFSVVRIFPSANIAENASGAPIDSPAEILKLISDDVSPGVQVLIKYMFEYSDWDGRLRLAVVDELNGRLVSEFGGAPHYRRSVERRSWSNYKKELWKLVEKSGKSKLIKWK